MPKETLVIYRISSPLKCRLAEGEFWLALAFGLLLWLTHHSLAVAAQPPVGNQCDWSGQSYGDFYLPPDPGILTPDRLGEVLRVEHLRSFTAAEVAEAADLPASLYSAEAYRVLFLSQGPLNIPQAVSGLLLVPVAAEPANDLPTLVYGHATTGLADQCAPSRYEVNLQSLLPWLAQGYRVVAPDYVGLGTPGLHPYGIGQVAGFSMLDGARAARHFCDQNRAISTSASNQFFLEGHSQGGHSALFGHELWQTYAPELDLLGTVTFAPGAELRFLAQQTVDTRRSMRIAPLSLAMYAYRNYYSAPDSLQPWLQEPYASELPLRAETECVVEIADWLGFRVGQIFQPALLNALSADDWESLRPWTDYIDLNTPGNFTSDAPVLILQGDLDPIVPPETSVRLTQRLCDQGTPVKLNQYAGLGHTAIVRRVRPDALRWMNDRRANSPLFDSCSEPVSVRNPAVSRALEPVTLTGGDVVNLFGKPVDELFLFAYKNEGWQQIPVQIDEVTISGDYTSFENGILDNNDEIVFMVIDAGYQAPAGMPIDQILPTSAKWYELEVTDPTSPTNKSWTYLVHSTELTTLNTDYVDFNPLTRRLHSEVYELGFPPFRYGADYLALGDGVDILDRTKSYLDCNLAACPITEETMPFLPNHHVTKDGPVRVILHQNRLFAYGSMISWTKPYTIPIGLNGSARTSTDFNQAASGSTYYNAAVPEGIVVDGSPDLVPAEPVSAWWQLSTDTGTIIQVNDVAVIGGTPSNFYIDDASLDQDDTGDQQHFGDTGIAVNFPNRNFDHHFIFYMLPDRQPNVGATYATFFSQPLQVSAIPHSSSDGSLFRMVYLPLVIK